MIVAEKKKKQGRNEPCACGSGKKYKKCCSGTLAVSEHRALPIASLIQEALAHHKSGNFDAAETIYHQVLLREKNNANALQLLGEIAYQRKEYASAVDLIGQAIRINQTSPVIYTNFGNALRETGKYEAACDAFIHAIDLKPADLLGYENLADTIKKSNAFDDRSLLYLMKGLAHEAIRPEYKYGILIVLGYLVESSPEWNKEVFERVILPSTKDALDRGDHLFAYYLNALTAISYAQQPHTSEQWKIVHEGSNPMYIAAGEKLRKALDPLGFPDVSDQSRVIGFIVDLSVGSGSGGVLLLNLLRGLSKLNPKPFELIVYTLEKASDDFEALCSEFSIKLVDLSRLRGNLSSEKDLFQRLLTLRRLIKKDKVAALVYPGTYEAFPCFAASIGMAPVQIYLSMGFRSISVPAIDAYVTSGSPVKSEKFMEGRYWKTGSVPHADLYFPMSDVDSMALDKEVSRIRNEHFGEYKVILGTIARAQKIDSPRFIKALASILRANPEVVFLWFGIQELSSVRKMMDVEGISNRCLFQGWCKVELYAKLIDIHIDSFPKPTGLSMLDTMSASTAFVWMEEDQDIGVGSNVMPLVKGEVGTKKEQEEMQKIFRHPNTGEVLALCADSSAEYIDYVQNLIDDVEFRKAVGDAGRGFVEHFCHDPSVAAKAYAEHFMDIIDEQRKHVICKIK